MTKYFCFILCSVLTAFLLFNVSLIGSDAIDNLFSGTSVLGSEVWSYRKQLFGAFSLLYGTAAVAAIALVIAVPLSLCTAVFLSEYLSGKARAIAKVVVELLAGVPSIVIGLLGVLYLRDFLTPLHTFLGFHAPDSLFTAGVLLSAMLIPTVASLSDDALRSVPRSFREAAYGLGFTKNQVIRRVLLPKARAGILGAILLAVGRSLGETVAVFLVVGRADRVFAISELSLASLFEAGQTVTSKLGGSEIAIAQGDTEHWAALMALALLLWLAVGLSAFAAQRLFLRQAEVTV